MCLMRFPQSLSHLVNGFPYHNIHLPLSAYAHTPHSGRSSSIWAHEKQSQTSLCSQNHSRTRGPGNYRLIFFCLLSQNKRLELASGTHRMNSWHFSLSNRDTKKLHSTNSIVNWGLAWNSCRMFLVHLCLLIPWIFATFQAFLATSCVSSETMVCHKMACSSMCSV